MKKQINQIVLLCIAILGIADFSFAGNLAGVWQHSNGERIEFKQQYIDNYHYVGYYISVGAKGQYGFYQGEDIVYLRSDGYQQFSGYIKKKWNTYQQDWQADSWSISGNTLYSSKTGTWTRVNATRNYPNLSGTWYQNGDSNYPCYISQNGAYLTFQSPISTSQGNFTNNGQLYASSWNATANISNDQQTIYWNNQNWTRSTSRVVSTWNQPTTTTTTSTTAIPTKWNQTATKYRGKNGTRVTCDCEPNGSFRSVWGTDTYTDDSSICTAAVHAGLISKAYGGIVTIEIRSGNSKYYASKRNGVSTGGYGKWNGSYVFVR